MKEIVMPDAFLDEWIKLIRPLFPRNARIETDAGNAVALKIDWKLGNDQSRPNKRSRLIRMVIPEETIQDCADFKTAGSRIKKVIQGKLSVFNPDHNTRRCGKRPTEEWVVSTLDHD
jgi:hypothetical protein